MLRNVIIVGLTAVCVFSVTQPPQTPRTALQRANASISASLAADTPATAAPIVYTVDNPRRTPDPTLTPGDALPVTAADICVPGYAKKVRNVPADVRAQVWKEYGLPPQKGRGWEVDHLISLELGGSNSLKNLWPQPGAGPMNYHDKDALENTLHADVCTNKITLTDAQHAISTDWEAAYAQYVGGKP